MDPRVQWDGHTTDEKYARIRRLAALDGPAPAICELPHQTIQLHQRLLCDSIAAMFAAARGAAQGDAPEVLRADQ